MQHPVKKLALVIGGPFLLVLGVTVAVIWWDRGAPPGFRPPVSDREVAALTRDDRGVRVHGTAHYDAKVKQQALGSDEAWYIFPLMAPGDTMGREIHALVRTQHIPNSLYGYEDMTVEGLARPPGRLVPRATQEAMLNRGYHFDDHFVLIEAFDD